MIDMTARSHGFVYPQGMPPCAQCGMEPNDQTHVNPAVGGRNPMMASGDGIRIVAADLAARKQHPMRQPRRSHGYTTGYNFVTSIPCQACSQPMGASCHSPGLPAGSNTDVAGTQTAAELEKRDAGTAAGPKEGYGQIVLVRHPFKALPGLDSVDADYKLCGLCGFAQDDEVHAMKEPGEKGENGEVNGDSQPNLVVVKQLAREAEPVERQVAANDPVDKALWASCVAAAKKKFTVYPSAYANGWAVQQYKARGGKWREKASYDDRVPFGWDGAGWDGRQVASASEGLGKWFAEKWVDISRTNPDGSHPACGRPTEGMSSGDYKAKYPKCVPSSKAKSMSPAARKSAVERKREADNAGGGGKGQAPKMVATEKAASEPSATAKDKDPQGGLSAAGRKKFGVKKGVVSYSSASPADKSRWVRWALRFTKTPRPLKDDKGAPTRYALMFHAWGEPVPTSDSAVRAVHAKAMTRRGQLGMGDRETAAFEGELFHHDFERDIRTNTCQLCGGHQLHGEHDMTDEPEALPTLVGVQRAFVTAVSGKTLITGPASVFTEPDDFMPRELAAAWETASASNPHFQWIEGRFVEADRPNRNKAAWSSNDLEMGEPTVAHGPLNWLHEERHIIGAIAAAKLVVVGQEQRQAAASFGQEEPNTHIRALAPVWRYLYPTEARQIAQASDERKLWYSMECVSREVACLESGCAHTQSYSDYMLQPGSRCGHVKAGGNRQFKDPSFLGGAVIIPPVRPGWGGANATVMRQAAMMAERQEASLTGLSEQEAVSMVASLITYAGGTA